MSKIFVTTAELQNMGDMPQFTSDTSDKEILETAREDEGFNFTDGDTAAIVDFDKMTVEFFEVKTRIDFISLSR